MADVSDTVAGRSGESTFTASGSSVELGRRSLGCGAGDLVSDGPQSKALLGRLQCICEHRPLLCV